MDIKVLGPGCAKCKDTERIVRETVASSGIDATVEKISDFQDIASYGVFTTPAVVIDGKVRCAGKVPKKKEILDWLDE